MVTKTTIKKALKKALDEKDPETNGTRSIITYPMADFRHQLKQVADLPQVKSVSFEFTEEEIKKQLTTVIFKTDTRMIRESYDYKTGNVECFCIGNDIDAVRETKNVSECVDFIRQYFPSKKRIIVVRKKHC